MNVTNVGTNYEHSFVDQARRDLKEIENRGVSKLETLEDLKADTLHEELIKKYNSIDAKYGYNVKNEGIDNHKDYELYELDSFFFNKSILQYDIYGNYIKQWNSIYDANKLYTDSYYSFSIYNVCIGISATAFGYQWCFINNSNSINDISNTNSKSVLYSHNNYKINGIYCYYKDGRFFKKYTCREQAYEDLKPNVIYDTFVNELKRCFNEPTNNYYKGYRWSLIYQEKLDLDLDIDYKREINKKVVQFDKKTGCIIEVFNSIKEASEKTNVYYVGIARCCSGERKSTKYHMWAYLKDIV